MLRSTVARVRDNGRPVLVSPPVRHRFGGNGQLNLVTLHSNGRGENLLLESDDRPANPA